MRSVCVGVAETGGMDTYAKRVCWHRRDRGNGHIREACVLASPRQGEWTHTRSVCVGVAETGGMDTYAKRVCRRRRDRGNGHIREACVLASPRQGGRRPLQDKTQLQQIAKIKNMHFVPSAYRLPHARHTFICGRAGNACTNLLGFFVRYVRTRGMPRLRRA